MSYTEATYAAVETEARRASPRPPSRMRSAAWRPGRLPGSIGPGAQRMAPRQPRIAASKTSRPAAQKVGGKERSQYTAWGWALLRRRSNAHCAECLKLDDRMASGRRRQRPSRLSSTNPAPHVHVRQEVPTGVTGYRRDEPCPPIERSVAVRCCQLVVDLMLHDGRLRAASHPHTLGCRHHHQAASRPYTRVRMSLPPRVILVGTEEEIVIIVTMSGPSRCSRRRHRLSGSLGPTAMSVLLLLLRRRACLVRTTTNVFLSIASAAIRCPRALMTMMATRINHSPR